MGKKKKIIGAEVSVIIIVAIATGILVWKYEKNKLLEQKVEVIEQENSNNSEKEVQQKENPQIILQKRASESSNKSTWKTYKSFLGFSFNYPPSFNVEEDANKLTINAFNENEQKLLGPDSGSMTRITVNIRNKTVEEIIDEIKLSTDNSFKRNTVLINGINTISITYKGAFAGETHYITIIKNQKKNNVIEIRFLDMSYFQTIFQDILSSVKII